MLREWTDNLNTDKQLQAIIPNIIHSFDATHLIQVILDWDKNKYILPIHDCFGTHPNHMYNLSQVVKKQFVKIYSDYKFLEVLRNNLINDLKKYRIEIIEKDKEEYIKVNIKNKKRFLKLPVLPKKGELNIEDVLNSTYMIS